MLDETTLFDVVCLSMMTRLEAKGRTVVALISLIDCVIKVEKKTCRRL